MISLLIFKSSRCIDQPVLKGKIEIGLHILRMHQLDHLFRPAGQHIIQFWVWSGGIKKSCFLQRPFISIKSMKAGIPAWLHQRWKEYRTGSCSIISQKNVCCRNRKPFWKICYRRIECIVAGWIEITKPEGNWIFILIPPLQTICAGAPWELATQLTETATTLSYQVALGESIYSWKNKQDCYQVCNFLDQFL